MTMDESGDRRVRKLHDHIPVEWDKNPLSLAHELREFLKSVVDAGTSIDSGGGDGCADLWPIIGGVEYHIAITTGNVPMTDVRAQEIAEELALDPTVQRTGTVTVAALKRAIENERKDDD